MTGRKGNLPRWILHAGALLLAAALLGCGGATKPAPTGGNTPPPTPGSHRPTGIVMTPQQRLQASRNLRGTLPPQAYAALAQLGLQTPSPAHSRRASVAVPYSSPDITQPYVPGDSGWIAKSADVVETQVPWPSMDMAPAGSTYPGNFSYVIYRVDDVAPTPLSLILYSQASSTPVGVCVYNWAYGAAGRWEPLFYGAPDGIGMFECHLDAVPGASWTNAGGDLAFVLFCLNPSTLSCTSFTLSDQTANDPPVGVLHSTPGSGPAPLNVTLDASQSYDDDGTVASYRFDPLGDGNFIDNGNSPSFPFSYDTPGSYHPVIEVTDNEGLTGTSIPATIIASPAGYDEDEDNDASGQANSLPTLPFNSFYGNIGPTGGYDGDQEDWFTFDAQEGDEGFFFVDWSNEDGANVVAWVEDFMGTHCGGSVDGDYPAQKFYYNLDGTFAPYYLRVSSGSGMSDYVISNDNAVYDENEEGGNDDPASANRLDALTDSHSMTDYDASLGSNLPGYPGYDGDSDDWYYFGTGGPNFHLNLNVTYDAGTGNIGVTLLDFLGNELASSATGSGSEIIDYDFQPEDMEPFILHVAASSGYSDYQMNGTTDLVNPGYDEDEPNDGTDQANLLDDVPFTGFTGNIGSGGDYDGDFDDYFTFIAAAGDKLKFTVTPTETSPTMAVYAFDSNFRPIGATETDGITGTVTLHVLIRSSDVPPYFFYVSYFGTDNDYTIDGEVDDFFESENNDNNGQANPLGSTFFPFFSGSLGSGGSDYDGDSFDVFTFDAELGDDVNFTVFYDDGTGNMLGYIRDSNGNELGSFSDNGNGSMDVNTTSPIGPGDTPPFYLELTPGIGNVDYWIQRTPPFN